MQSGTRKLALGAVLAVLGVGGERPSWAQTAEATPAASNTGLQEVVVTAERRTEKLMDVPMSVTALSQDALDVKGVHNIDDLSRVAPGVTFLRNGMSASGNYNDEDSDISIRGIDSTAGAATTGIYIDDTPIQTRHLNFGTVNPYPGALRSRPGGGAEGPAGHLVRLRLRGRHAPLHHADARTYGIFGLCARGVRTDRRRWAELRDRRGRRRPDHRWRARLPHQRFVPRGRRMGRPRELHATDPGRADGLQSGKLRPPLFWRLGPCLYDRPDGHRDDRSPTPTGTTRTRCERRCAGRRRRA